MLGAKNWRSVMYTYSDSPVVFLNGLDSSVPLPAILPQLSELPEWISGEPAFPESTSFEEDPSRCSGEASVIHQLRESRRYIILAHERTRKEVANLLHSQVQSRLLVLEYWLNDCQELLKDGPQDVLEHLRNARSVLGEIIQQDLRSITNHLYPAIIRKGLPGALRSLANRFHCIFAVEIEIDRELAEQEASMSSELNDTLRLTIYRVAEEALTNATKHSHADKVTIRLGFSREREIYLTIQDNGRGFDPAKVLPGNGLLSMEEYVEAMGGKLEVDSTPGQGTTVRVCLPATEGIKSLAKV